MKTMAWKRYVLILFVSLLATPAWSEPIKEIKLYTYFHDVKALKEVKEGEKILIRGGNQKGEEFMAFVAYFCDWEQPVFQLSAKYGFFGTCIFKNNRGFESYLNRDD